MGVPPSEELLLGQLSLLPRGVAKDDVEAPRPARLPVLRFFSFLGKPEHLGELHVPVEEAQALRQVGYLGPHGGRDNARVFDQTAEHVVGDLWTLSSLLLHEGGAPSVRQQLRTAIDVGLLVGLEGRLLPL